MDDIFERARDDRARLPLEVMAHRLSAEYHRHRNMVLGGLSTVLTTLVGTAVFTGLVSQLGLTGEGELRNPFAGEGMDWFYIAVVVLSVSAPIAAALHSFVHDAEDAATHKASAEGYANVMRRLTVFLARHDVPGLTPDGLRSAIQEYDEIMTEYTVVLGRSIPLTKSAYRAAQTELRQGRVRIEQPGPGPGPQSKRSAWARLSSSFRGP